MDKWGYYEDYEPSLPPWIKENDLYDHAKLSNKKKEQMKGEETRLNQLELDRHIIHRKIPESQTHTSKVLNSVWKIKNETLKWEIIMIRGFI